MFLRFASSFSTIKYTIPIRRYSMKIAVEGCCHGELDAIYNHVGLLETKNGYKVDALLICGDFQAMRNYQDLQCMACPDKYKKLQDFHQYYTSQKKAPVLTLVIGGNHEASNYNWELYHGGWLAPNIYYLGSAGSVRLNGVPIAGASGIFKSHDFRLGHFETVPYSPGTMRSIYHIRELSVRKLSLLSKNRIFLSHDWPNSIEQYGNLDSLLKRKAHFRSDVENGTLGSPPLMGLLRTLKPEWWFAAHMHTRFEATVPHEGLSGVTPQPVKNPDEIQIDDDDEFSTAEKAPVHKAAKSFANPDEITMNDEEEDVDAPPPPPPPPPPASETKFLALDKCLPKRQFMEIIDIDADPTINSTQKQSRAPSTPLLSYDPEWLAITRAFHPWFSTTRTQRSFPGETEARALVGKELEWVKKNIETNEKGEIPVSECQKFVMTAPGPGREGAAIRQQPSWYTNPQTEAFCQMLKIPNKVNPPPKTTKPTAPTPQSSEFPSLAKSIGA